jgi:hypothetical protein
MSAITVAEKEKGRAEARPIPLASLNDYPRRPTPPGSLLLPLNLPPLEPEHGSRSWRPRGQMHPGGWFKDSLEADLNYGLVRREIG